MPTVLVLDGYRFFFYSNENTEPPHVHVEKAEAAAKWWLTPVAEAWTTGFSGAQRRRIREILTEHQHEIVEKWHDYFGTGR